MRSFAIVVASILLSSCTVGPGGTCQNPVVDACSEKASEISTGLAKAASEAGKTPDEMTAEFMSACEGQLQSDLDQTANAIALITADGGLQTHH